MPAMEYHGTPSHASPFSYFGRSLLSLRRDAPASSATASAMPPAQAPGADSADLDEFQRRLAARLADLLRGAEGSEDPEFLSATWVRRLLDTFLACQDDFRGLLPHSEKLAAEVGERAVKALDVCNAARDGVDQARRWERLAGVAAAAVLARPPGEVVVHEGGLRRARKALADLSALLLDAAAADASLASSSQRTRSFGRAARASPSSSSSHLRSRSWSVSRAWSAARQLHAISAGLSAPRAHESCLPASAYAVGCLLHLAAWALVAAVPCPDRAAALHQPHHLPSPPVPRAGFPWAPSLLALQERLAEEARRKDRRGSPGLLTEIRALETAARRLAEVIDAASVVPLAGDREAEVREAAAELAAACAALRAALEPLERQVREMFHRIVRCRVEGLDSPMISGD